MSVHGEFCWIELTAPDTAAARDFYAALCGWTYEPMAMPVPGGTYYVAQHGGQGIAGLMGLPERCPPAWTLYVAVDDADATAAKAVELGGRVEMPPYDIPEVGRMLVLSDPAGAAIACLQPLPQAAPPPPAMAPGGIAWRELATPDLPGALAFYGALFGWQGREEPFPGQPGSVYGLFAAGGRDIAGILPLAGPQMAGIPPHWAVYFATADLAASVATAERHGGALVRPPFAVPGIGDIAVIRDPGGAVAMLMQPA
ncbi:MAG TPA: VOC family protein [Alphaproteobacteria bacterium]|nr:VOC family protein [Alphaproteobacteria bacterium]